MVIPYKRERMHVINQTNAPTSVWVLHRRNTHASARTAWPCQHWMANAYARVYCCHKITKHAHSYRTHARQGSLHAPINYAYQTFIDVTETMVSAILFWTEKFHSIGKIINSLADCIDCGDNSDENAWPSSKHPCLPHMFQCKSDNKCIPDYFLCDHDNDCEDGSDEHNCTFTDCKPEYFRCRNGRCINNVWKCGKNENSNDLTPMTVKTNTEINSFFHRWWRRLPR